MATTFVNLAGEARLLVQEFVALRERAERIGPRVLQQAAKFPTFLAFVRHLDPTVPTHARYRDGKPGWLAHPIYIALNYAWRLARTARYEALERGAKVRPKRKGGKR